jgi:NAD-dependent dihydropyrimidine dehydrogenase PreA subunit
MKPVLDERKCPALDYICKAIPACPVQAISYLQDDDLPLDGKIIFVYGSRNNCGECVEACCGSAIEVK